MMDSTIKRPLFLLRTHVGGYRKRFAYGTTWGGHVPELIAGAFCAACGKQRYGSRGLREGVVGGPAKWPDVLDAARDVTAVFSGRAVEGMASCTGVSFASMPVRHEKAGVVPPPYFHPSITGRVMLDEEVLDRHFEITCSVCGLRRNKTVTNVRRYKLNEGSWDGSDFCKFGNVDLPHIVCSEKVIHIAHEQRWTNAYFVLVDSDQDHPDAVDGIDYLAKKWPPASWELPDPLAEQPLDAWARQLAASDAGKVYEARKVLCYVGEPARGVLIPVLDSTNAIARRDAANILYRLHRSVPLEPAVLARVLGLKSVPT